MYLSPRSAPSTLPSTNRPGRRLPSCDADAGGPVAASVSAGAGSRALARGGGARARAGVAGDVSGDPGRRGGRALDHGLGVHVTLPRARTADQRGPWALWVERL